MNIRFTALALLLAAGIASAASQPARADEVTVIVGPHNVPVYEHWQPAWDREEFDRHHVILGTVTNFQPFRLQVARHDGAVQMIDLKDGTVILPTGTTPMVNERVAIVGYYSHGTFIANRVLVRS
jgi:ABC-type nitrate/sulfonate/bicarbonate transport system substrate-binding protein